MVRMLAGLLLLAGVLVLMSPPGAGLAAPTGGTLLASGLQGTTLGSTIGPDGALYVGESGLGRISRVDLQTGAISTYATGLPKTIPDVGLGGVMDVAFYGDTLYALLTLVGTDVGGSDVVGIYRVDPPNGFTVIADLGQFSLDNPPVPDFFVLTGVPFALEAYRDGFLVTDGHHNRVLYVTLGGQITELVAFDNIVPTGLSISGTTVYMGEAGPVPHAPETGKVVTFNAQSPSPQVLASGASLVIDVERGRGGQVYALSQGPSVPGTPEGSPGQPDSGKLLRVKGDGTLSVLVDRLNLPSSFEIEGDTAYILTLPGEVWKVEGISDIAGAPAAPAPPSITPPAAGDGGLLSAGSGWALPLAVAVAGVASFGLLRRRRSVA